jgi:hypothetical protein
MADYKHRGLIHATQKDAESRTPQAEEEKSGSIETSLDQSGRRERSGPPLLPTTPGISGLPGIFLKILKIRYLVSAGRRGQRKRI